jgi:hypothetical protein
MILLLCGLLPTFCLTWTRWVSTLVIRHLATYADHAQHSIYHYKVIAICHNVALLCTLFHIIHLLSYVIIDMYMVRMWVATHINSVKIRTGGSNIATCYRLCFRSPCILALCCLYLRTFSSLYNPIFHSVRSPHFSLLPLLEHPFQFNYRTWVATHKFSVVWTWRVVSRKVAQFSTHVARGFSA